MMLRITAVSGEQKGITHDYSTLPITIGRYPDNDIVITDAIVSRRHCAILPTEAGTLLHDMGSQNGTYLNGVKIGGDSILATGDVITVGIINLQFTICDS